MTWSDGPEFVQTFLLGYIATLLTLVAAGRKK